MTGPARGRALGQVRAQGPGLAQERGPVLERALVQGPALVRETVQERARGPAKARVQVPEACPTPAETIRRPSRRRKRT